MFASKEEQKIFIGFINQKYPILTPSMSESKRLYHLCIDHGLVVDGRTPGEMEPGLSFSRNHGYFRVEDNYLGQKWVLSLTSVFGFKADSKTVIFPEFRLIL